MKLRLEQSLREGKTAVILSAWILPIWLMGAAVHRSHWANFISDLGWRQFLLGWGGLVWGVIVGILLIFWSAFSFLEDEGRLGRLWARCINGSIILLLCGFISIPGWVWLAELSGATGMTTFGVSLKSLLVPLGALLLANLQAVFLPTYLVTIGSFVVTALLSGLVWTELIQ